MAPSCHLQVSGDASCVVGSIPRDELCRGERRSAAAMKNAEYGDEAPIEWAFDMIACEIRRRWNVIKDEKQLLKPSGTSLTIKLGWGASTSLLQIHWAIRFGCRKTIRDPSE